MLVLRQAVGDFVIVALAGHVDMDRQMRAGWRFKRVHGDSDRVLLDWIPEQRRAADGTESPPHFFGGAEPGEILGAVYRQGGAGNVG